MLLTDIKFGDEISVTLFSDIAQRCANEIKSHQEKKDTNKRTQLRHFYDELVMWHDKVFQERDEEKRNTTYQNLAPYIQMLNAKVAYASGRGHVNKNFEDFFSHCVKQITNPQTLKQCKLFFEAFLGYYRALND